MPELLKNMWRQGNALLNVVMFRQYTNMRSTGSRISFGLVKKYISNAECPEQPIKMINVISELVDKDLIIRDRLSKEHKKQLDALKTERQGSRKRARENDECSEDDWINSPSLNDTFESLDSVNGALLSMTAESMEASIHNIM